MKNKMTLGFLCILTAVLLCTVGCSPVSAPAGSVTQTQPSTTSVPSQTPAQTPAQTIEVVDVLDRTVTVQGPIERAYYGFYYENLVTVVGPEAFTKIAATSLYDTEGYFMTLCRMYSEYLPGYDDMTDVGSTIQDDFNLEMLLDLDLDVVIMGGYQYSAIESRLSVLEDAGIPVVVIDYTKGTLEMQSRSTQILGKLFGVEERAQELIDQYEAAYADIESRIAKVTQRKTVWGEHHSQITTYQDIGLSGALTTYFGNSFVRAGADNIMVKFAEQSEQTTIDPEYLLEADPDLIVMTGGEAKGEERSGLIMGHEVTKEKMLESARGIIASRPGWDSLKAVQDNQIIALDNGCYRTLYDYCIVQFMAKTLYPDLFEDIEPEANMKAFYEKYMPTLPVDGMYFYKLTKDDIA